MKRLRKNATEESCYNFDMEENVIGGGYTTKG